jgi:MFS family permease
MALLIAFVAQQRSSSVPYFAHLRTGRTEFLLHNVANVALHFTAFAVPLIVPYFLARVAGYGPFGIGVALALSPIGMLLGSSSAPAAIRRLGARRCAFAAMLCLGLGTLAIALGAHTTVAVVLVALLVNGFGIGLLQVVYTDVIVATLPREARGVAGGLTMLTRTIGVVVAASALTAALAALEASHAAAGVTPHAAHVSAFGLLFAVLATIPLLVCLAVAARTAMFRPER